MPNPSSGRFDLASDADLVSVRLWDATGREVHRQALGQGRATLDTGLPAGTYVLEAITRDGLPLRTRILIVRP